MALSIPIQESGKDVQMRAFSGRQFGDCKEAHQ